MDFARVALPRDLLTGTPSWAVIGLLLLAGVGAGITGSTAGLASLVSYPMLLALGLPPVTANVTNTVALIGSSIGSVTGSRRELRGQGPELRRWLPIAAAGGGQCHRRGRAGCAAGA